MDKPKWAERNVSQRPIQARAALLSRSPLPEAVDEPPNHPNPTLIIHPQLYRVICLS